MNIAITGGSGFIGRNLAKFHLQLGDNVKSLSRRPLRHENAIPKVNYHYGSLLDEDVLKNFLKNTDILYHCAAELNDYSQMHLTNIDGMSNLLKCSRGEIGRWIQLSSASIYQSERSGIITEASAETPDNLYEYTKQKSDFMLQKYAEENNLDFTIIRPTKVFGPEMNNYVLYKLFELIEKKLFFYLGNGVGSVNYIYIDNLVTAMHKSAVNKKAIGETFILSDNMPIKNFAIKIATILNVPPPTFFIPEKIARGLASITSFIPNNPLTIQRINAMTRSATYSSNKIVKTIGYNHEISIEDGLSRTIKAWRGAL